MRTTTSGEVENKAERNFSSPSGAKIREQCLYLNLDAVGHGTCDHCKLLNPLQ
jgi:hypothetical protein